MPIIAVETNPSKSVIPFSDSLFFFYLLRHLFFALLHLYFSISPNLEYFIPYVNASNVGSGVVVGSQTVSDEQITR